MKTIIYAHRGASEYSPENTLEAFSLAAEMKADGIELDVHKTLDGKIVVSHDGNLKRCGNADINISDIEYSELKNYSVANGFEKYKNAKVPLLSEVYELLYDTGLLINVEIKASGEDFLKSLADLTEKYNMSNRVLYSSFSKDNLKLIAKYQKNAPCAFLYGESKENEPEKAKEFGWCALHPYFSIALEKDFVKNCHDKGIKVNTWTVNEASDMEKLIFLGCDGIITNKPDLAYKTRESVK